MNVSSRNSLAWALLGIAAGAAMVRAAVTVPSPPQAHPPAFLQAMSIERLPNGLRLVLVPYASPGVMAYYTLVRVGSRNEVEPGHSGFAHLFEHMMFRGTEHRTAAEYEDKVTSLGLEGNAFTTDDDTVYYYTGPSSALPEVIALEADRFRYLRYSKEAFQTEAKAVLGEYNKNFSNPINQMLETLQRTMFRRHTYRHTTMGFLADIEAMHSRYDYSLKFFRRWYQPDNCTVFVVGDFQPEEVKRLVSESYGSWAGTSETAKVPAEPEQRKELRTHVDWATETYPRLIVAYRTTAARLDTRDAAVQTVLAGYLFGPTSDLYHDLVLDNQIAIDLESLYEDHRDPWYFGPLVVLKQAADLSRVDKAVRAQMAALRAGKIDRVRFAEVQSHTRYRLQIGLETPSEIGVALAQAASASGDPQALGKALAQVAMVTPEEAIAFAKKFFGDQNRTVVTLTGKRRSSR